jgi:hypothetical protein
MNPLFISLWPYYLALKKFPRNVGCAERVVSGLRESKPSVSRNANFGVAFGRKRFAL